MEYTVKWEIEVNADNPREAAEEAFKCVNRPGTPATVFDVAEFKPDNPHSQQYERIDLSEGE